MKLVSRRSLQTFVRIVWGTTVFLVILLAVCVQLGRTAFPYLNDYKSLLEDQLSLRLNSTITVGEIQASWDGLRPAITLLNVRVSGGPYEGQLHAEQLSAQINLLATFKDWRLALGKLDFEGLRAEMVQSEDGSWAVVGLPQSSAGDSNFTIDDPLDIFLFGRRLELNETSLVMRFRTGHTAEMTIPSVSLENDANFHRLKAKVDVDKDSNAFYLVVEGQGDPRDDKNFEARGYLQLQQFPLQKVVAATGLHKGLDIEPGLWSDGSRMDFQLWFEGSTAKGMDFSGGGKASGLPFKLPGEAEAPAIPQFKFTGRWDKQNGLFAQIANLGLTWPQAEIPPLDIELRAGLNTPAQLRIRELDVTAWSQAVGALKLNNVVAKLQDLLKPGGTLRDIGVTVTTAEQGYFHLQANVFDAAVESWQGAPQVRHATGFVEATAFKGRMVIDANNGFVMHYPIVYKKPLDFYQASGEVAWFVNLESSMVYVTSGLLNLKGESGEGAGYLYLSLPTKRLDNIEPEMTLVVGMRESVARYHEAYVPYTIPDSLYNWLGQSIKDGDLTDGGFIYRGSLLGTPMRPRSLQLSMKIHSGELAFDPAWPVLKNADASLLVDDLGLAVTIDKGELLGNTLTGGRVALVESDDNKMALSITGNASGDAKSALALLRSSPVQDIAGEALAQFQAAGSYNGSVELFIPLDGGLNDGWQDIQASLDDGVFQLPALDLTFNAVKGDIRYHTKEGLTAKDITATLWQQPVQGHLITESDEAGRVLNLAFSGVADVVDLKGWLNRPIFNYIHGQANVSGELTLPFDHPTQGVALELTSQLEGVELNFPAPYSKPAHQAHELTVEYEAPRHSPLSYISVRSAFDISSQMMMEGGAIKAMDVSFSEPNRLREGSIRLHGNVGDIDAGPWSDFVLEYIDALTQSPPSGALADTATQVNTKAVEAPIFSMALRANTVTLGELVVDRVALWGRELEDSWYFDLETPKAVANYQRFNDDRPDQLHFEYLHLPSTGEETDPQREKQSFLANVALEHLEPMDVRIDELAFGGEGWGHIAFDYRPERRGLVAKRIRGNIRGLKTTDGTLAIYKRSENEWESSFSGAINTANVGDVLENFDYPRALVSDTATFDVSLNWPGHPDQLNLNSLAGTVELQLNNGHFIQGETGDDRSLLKLISLLNFDTLVRRLRLDFSDLRPEGLSYDSVSGKLYFEKETVKIKAQTPLVVDTTSADLQLVGDIGLASQTIDSQLVATLPIAGNLAVAAALTAGLPAAVGVYVVGKLFKEQVDELASVRYNVTGSWEEPKLEVDKIFEAHASGRAENKQVPLELEQLYPPPEPTKNSTNDSAKN